jgi:hypothetical protein
MYRSYFNAGEKKIMIRRLSGIGINKIVAFLLSACACSFATNYNEYADLNRELMLLPASASLAGADLSLSSGACFGSCPSNLPFDSLNNLSLSYANFFQNTFSTSLLSFSGPADSGGGIGITAGYVYIPDIEDNRNTVTTESNTLIYDYKIKNCSDIFFRFGYGHLFSLNSRLIISAGVAANARRTRLIDYSGYGLGLDGGAKLLDRQSGVSAVLQMENITSHYTYWSKDYRVYSYPHLRLGLGIDRNIPYIYGRIRIGYTSPDLLSNEGINYSKTETDTNDQKIEVLFKKKVYKNPELLFNDGRLGLEYTIMNRVALRAGLSQGKINFGAGLKLFSNRAGLDFAYTIHQLAGTYQVSMMYRW